MVPPAAIAVARAMPDQVQQIAAQYGVTLAVAAMMLANMMQQQGQALPAMAGGGRPTGPTIVGEQGPEVFVPDVPGSIVPMAQGGWSPWSTQNTYSPIKRGEFEPPPQMTPEQMRRYERRTGGSTPLGWLEKSGRQINPEAWDALYENLPESKNVVDLRNTYGPHETRPYDAGTSAGNQWWTDYSGPPIPGMPARAPLPDYAFGLGGLGGQLGIGDIGEK